MASNRVLIESILGLALALGSTAPETEGKTNAELVIILNGLKAEKAPEPEPAAPVPEPEPKPEPEPESEPEPELKFYIVAGKALTSKRGILSDGDEINAEDLPDGLKALKAFVKSGYVVKK
jgi:purine-binding chemotaxis protein CheW